MPENRVEKAARVLSPRLYNLVLWLAFFGMLISLNRIVYQEQKLDRMERDFHLLRQQSQREINDLRNAQSVSLEQDLLRLDQLTTQLQKKQARTSGNKPLP